MHRIVFTTFVILLQFCTAAETRATTHNRIEISTTAENSESVAEYASILTSEVARRTQTPVAMADASPAADSAPGPAAAGLRPLHVALHTTDSLSSDALPFGLSRTDLPDETDPGPEGFLIVRTGDTVHIVGVDQRGVLYGVGELLRQLTFAQNTVELSDSLAIRSAPAFEVRGCGVSQGHTITQLTGSREWTEAEWKQAVVGYALAGANTLSLGYSVSENNPAFRFARLLGLKVLVSTNPNQGIGEPEWTAKEAIGRTGYLCLSVPEARAFKLKTEEERWKNSPPVDYVRMKSGDGGGCECARCRPYGAVFIQMCHEIARIIHRYHPETELFVLNQKLDNDGDRAIFQFLQEHRDPWLRAIAVGPGSNAMGWMPGRRQDHRMDLFRYPAFGAMDRYYREMLKQMPPAHDLVFFTDVTHWVYAQNGLMDHALIPDRNHDLPPQSDHYIYDRKPDPALHQVYDRRAFNARPAVYHDFFRESMRYGIGDVNYSEGHHDHFNSWMWQRLLWAPDMPLDDLIAEYARLFFGPAAAPQMADAIRQFEANLQTPIADNPGIERFAELVRSAGKKIPANLMKNDYLWRQYMQRALTDLYIQSDVRAQTKLLNELLATAGNCRQPQDVAEVLQQLRQQIDRGKQMDTSAPEWLREALQLGRESDAVYGVQIAGMYNLDQDYVGLGWNLRRIEQAEQSEPATACDILRELADYEMKSVDALYDDLGDPDNSPHVTIGWPFGDGIFDLTSRRSQRSCAFTTDEEQGVTLEYDRLDPNAQYIARMTLVRPSYLERFGIFQFQTRQSIYADDQLLSEQMELPEYTPERFEFPIPRAATADGRLTISCLPQPEVGAGDPGDVTVWRNTGGWGTLLSEVWLYKKTE